MLQGKLILIVVVLVCGWGMALQARKGVSAGQRGSGHEPGRGAGVKYLALGDSYTIGEAVEVEERYPVQLRRMLAEDGHVACSEPEIIAVTGWTTGNLLGALAAGKPEGREGGGGRGGEDGKGTAYDVVSLLIGVNNQFQGRSQAEYREQFELLLEKSIGLAGGRPGRVVVLSIPDYSVTPFGRMADTSLIAAQIDSFNGINLQLARKYGVNYVDVTGESRRAASDPSLIAGDGLHFSGKEYEVWARLMEPVVKGMLK